MERFKKQREIFRILQALRPITRAWMPNQEVTNPSRIRCCPGSKRSECLNDGMTGQHTLLKVRNAGAVGQVQQSQLRKEVSRSRKAERISRRSYDPRLDLSRGQTAGLEISKRGSGKGRRRRGAEESPWARGERLCERVSDGPARQRRLAGRTISATSFTLTKHSHQFSFGAKARRLMEGNIDFTGSCCLALKVTPGAFCLLHGATVP